MQGLDWPCVLKGVRAFEDSFVAGEDGASRTHHQGGHQTGLAASHATGFPSCAYPFGAACPHSFPALYTRPPVPHARQEECFMRISEGGCEWLLWVNMGREWPNGVGLGLGMGLRLGLEWGRGWAWALNGNPAHII